MELSVHYCSVEGEEDDEGTGMTENVSAGGAYFLSPDRGELVEGRKLALRLSGIDQYTVGATFKSLHGEGTILRVERINGKVGVAVEFDDTLELDTAA